MVGLLFVALAAMGPSGAASAGTLPNCAPRAAPADQPDEGWIPLGVKPDAPIPVEADMVREMTAGGTDPAKATTFVKEYVGSGSTVPVEIEAPPGETLEKLVPAGQTPSPYTGYWARVTVIDAAEVAPERLADMFALPPSTAKAPAYDVYRITSLRRTLVFRSTIAGTIDIDSCVYQTGGAEQTLVLNRNAFSTPVKVGSVSIPR